jgi:RHH-type proline utilization regulon transcriptional repressor/proline dehydrogenase/delta 1-pyrroline-5-carboxylate dehydrogenase
MSHAPSFLYASFVVEFRFAPNPCQPGKQDAVSHLPFPTENNFPFRRFAHISCRRPQAKGFGMGFEDFSRQECKLRAAISAHYRAAEPDCVKSLLAATTMQPEWRPRIRALAEKLILALRAKPPANGVENLLREYDLSSQEGVALMCLAEAVLRVPDRATRDALIRDKIGGGNWRAHLGHSPSLFVNAATWGLVVTGKLTATVPEEGFSVALKSLIARGGEPVIRKGVDLAMRMMGEQFVTGETIGQALTNARRIEAKGFSHSYDMLGEAAASAADAARYLNDYQTAIHAIGTAAGGRGPCEGPGISVKLSALHPRYTRSQRPRVMAELLPRLTHLATLACHYGIGFNIDAEEADRLDLSLDLLEALCLDARLAGWNGLGFVVQAYQKRAPHVLDWLIDLAHRSGHRLMIRLVKGAYWDSEIKRAQVDGQQDFPVFTRKLHTDVSYLACAQKMLGAPTAIFPQFATHNAHTVAAIHTMAGENFSRGQYEFQCLHGMGESLYEEVVGPEKLNRLCRIYAPVGTHETLLAYLVRRLLENGANASFVNRIRNPAVPLSDLAADPLQTAAAASPVGSPHPAIKRPPDLFAPARQNSTGLDLSDESRLRALAQTLKSAAYQIWQTVDPSPTTTTIQNPAALTERVGVVTLPDAAAIDTAIAGAAASDWPSVPAAARAKTLLDAAGLLETRSDSLLPLLIREAGKTISNAAGEIREAVDFLRYYATQAATWPKRGVPPLGVIACISPWNFPLAIFTGQLAAALAAGNTVLAKPAEETPLIAAQAVALLHAAGIPRDALHLLPGDGQIGATLIADPRITGVLFTGSTATARKIQTILSGRLNPDGTPVPLIAETGGQNALIVDSSALAEQVVTDILGSAFDSAGQRCSALRVLYLQEDIADRILNMLRGALAELTIGNPLNLATDIGPVITQSARENIESHIAAMQAAGHQIHRATLQDACQTGLFVAPTIIEIPNISLLTHEIFGPVLHVIRYRRENLGQVLADITGTGYALTLGIHSRIDETIARVTRAAQAGNIYVNRNTIGAVVGVQPFGGSGLSGTGPKAGGPLYLRRLLAAAPPFAARGETVQPEALRPWRDWLERHADPAIATWCRTAMNTASAGNVTELPGPVGERNLYSTAPRGTVLCIAGAQPSLLRQITTALATGNSAMITFGAAADLPPLPAQLSRWIVPGADPATEDFDAVLFEGPPDDLRRLNQSLAGRPGPIVQIHLARPDGTYPWEWLLRERVVTTNTAAAGGNANLLMIG